MIPSAIVVLEGLPLNPNGKVDRKALPEPEFANMGVGNYEAPQGEVEEALADIWAEVLGIAQVGRNDNFFELGGHSLAILQVQQKLQQALVRFIAFAPAFRKSPTERYCIRRSGETFF